MVVINPVANLFASLYNNEIRRNKSSLVAPSSKLLINILRTLQKEGYVGEFEVIDDGRFGKLNVQLLGRINKCGPITPRFPLKYREMIDLPPHIKKFLPSKELGIIIVSTPKGVMSHKDAAKERIGGIALGYVY
ncbi:30S ribosomal protein S8 [Sulfolobales archaeon HS-7]|nr:30S ribosomal protein S8 [Sulfolobales archaeon HS-7]